MNRVDTRHPKSRWVRLFISSSRWNVLVISVILLGLVWIYASRVPTSNAGVAGPTSPQVGFATPDLTLDTLDGAAITECSKTNVALSCVSIASLKHRCRPDYGPAISEYAEEPPV